MKYIKKIKLTPLELNLAIEVGVWRRMSAAKDGLRDKAGRVGDWNADVLGASGEMVLAKSLGIYWLPTNRTFDLPDVGEFEVKTVQTYSQDMIERGFKLRLPVEPGTPDERIVVLIYGQYDSYEVMGWTTGKDAKAYPPEKVKYRPCHWVPVEKLFEIEDLDLAPAK
jgi:hypothetical protein